MRNIYYIYISAENNTTEILHNGNIHTIEGIDVLQEINVSQPSIVFINYLYYIMQRYPGGKSTGEDYVKRDQHETLEYEYGKTVFRNITAFTNGQSEILLQDLYPGVPLTKAMEMYISSFGDPKDVIYTLAYQVKKMFYADIKEALWEFKKEHNAYYYDLDTYYDMLAGSKAGALCNEPVYAENVLCFDKRSAYASVMVNDDKFPIGKMVLQKKAKNIYITIRKNLNKGKYFKVVLDYNVPGFEIFYDEKEKKTGLEYMDFLSLRQDNKLEEFCEKITTFRLYYCQQTGRLPYILRQKIIEAFNNKESMTGVAKFFEKTKINILYGKGLQHYDFQDKKELQDHFRGKGRGDNYLQPEQSMHCAAVLRYEIHKAIRNNIAIYWDTDGIKVKNTPEAHCYFRDQNNIIRQKNRAAGFDSEIGTWKFEGCAKRFISFQGKQYITEWDNGKLEMTWAGVTKKDKEITLNCCPDVIKTALYKPIPVMLRTLRIDGDRLVIGPNLTAQFYRGNVSPDCIPNFNIWTKEIEE